MADKDKTFVQTIYKGKVSKVIDKSFDNADGKKIAFAEIQLENGDSKYPWTAWAKSKTVEEVLKVKEGQVIAFEAYHKLRKAKSGKEYRQVYVYRLLK